MIFSLFSAIFSTFIDSLKIKYSTKANISSKHKVLLCHPLIVGVVFQSSMRVSNLNINYVSGFLLEILYNTKLCNYYAPYWLKRYFIIFPFFLLEIQIFLKRILLESEDIQTHSNSVAKAQQFCVTKLPDLHYISPTL